MPMFLSAICRFWEVNRDSKKDENIFADRYIKSVFTHVASIYANLLEQKKAFT